LGLARLFLAAGDPFLVPVFRVLFFAALFVAFFVAVLFFAVFFRAATGLPPYAAESPPIGGI
jgi:hypothetical protein